ncbi:MAG: FlgD immunoglobulin-like domain containing protein, partial [bacterium]
TGEIGHKITLALDGRSDDKIDVTNLFNYDSGSYTRGAVIYPLGTLAEGRHTVEIKAWDNLNNSSSVLADFVVLPQDRLVLREVMNYPNPFRRQTSFTFDLNLDAEVRVKIFTLSGRLIRTLETDARPGFNMLPWDGRDEDGDELANGVYLYKVIATARNNEAIPPWAGRAEEISKLVVQR